ncbi:IRF3 factor, partial [Mionectes macconnelli]|nr:IRF3 factor [Mionectes macconnelli]
PARREAQKLRFGPWLLRAISSGRYRGLCWLDRERTTFRVPWKHNARKDITSSDLEIFKVRGFLKTSHPPKPPCSWRQGPCAHLPAPTGLGKGEWAWKTNFRCALSSTRMFKLLRDHSKCGEDPHKVF